LLKPSETIPVTSDPFGYDEDADAAEVEGAGASTMDLDTLFLGAVLREGMGAWADARSRGFTTELLEGPAKLIGAFVQDYVTQYKALPDLEVVSARFGVEFPSVSGPADFFTQQVLERSLARELQKVMADTTAILAKGEVAKAYETFRTGSRGLITFGQQDAVVPLGVAASQAMDRYDLVKSGVRGLQTPWPTLNDCTLGMWPENLWVFVARQGVGKTTVVNLLSLHAWSAGKRVLFVTTEMSQVENSQRLLSMHLKLDANQVRGGCLDAEKEDTLRDYVAKLKDLDRDVGFYFTGGNFTANPASIEAACTELEPDLLIADAPYLFKMGGKDRLDNTARAFNFLKGIARGSNMACVSNMQFNRDGAKEVAIENVGLTDAAGWNADYMGACHATPDDLRDRVLNITGLKLRNGQLHAPFRIRWDWRNMDFTEILASEEEESYDPGVESVPEEVF
jgi:hypothetical protein